MSKKTLNYPYLPKGKKINYADGNNEFIAEAKNFAKLNSLDENMPTGAVVVCNGKVIGYGANGSSYHAKFGCERVKRGIPTGEGYELCEGCHPRNHSEPKAIKDARTKNPRADLKKSDLYLWGHWWACEPCWKAIDEAGIRNVYLVSQSHKIFNKAHPDNVVGRQFSHN
jgi:deoxycytidylate deaminase